MTDNDIVPKIARKLREIRLNKHLTIQQLAERTHVSKGLLSKIENAKTIPSLPVFVQILQSFDISFLDFFDRMTEKDEQTYWLIRKHQHSHATGIDYHRIFSRAVPAARVELTQVTIRPGTKAPAVTGSGFKVSYVINGSCEYHFGNQALSLEAGDAICMFSSIRHHALNKSHHDASLLELSLSY